MSKTAAVPRRRDAATTRRLLLEAARNRFAYDGYAATTVREIADDAGVNVALISRYFRSKEGLFEACLESAAHAVSRSDGGEAGLTHLADAISRRVVGAAAEDGPDPLLLLLRSSGDERAEQLRVAVLHAFSERLATAAGWTPGDADLDPLLLRAQLVLSASIGLAVLRAAGRLEPLSSATQEQLTGPLRDLVDALLGTDRAR